MFLQSSNMCDVFDWSSENMTKQDSKCVVTNAYYVREVVKQYRISQSTPLAVQRQLYAYSWTSIDFLPCNTTQGID